MLHVVTTQKKKYRQKERNKQTQKNHLQRKVHSMYVHHIRPHSTETNSRAQLLLHKEGSQCSVDHITTTNANI